MKALLHPICRACGGRHPQVFLFRGRLRWWHQRRDHAFVARGVHEVGAPGLDVTRAEFQRPSHANRRRRARTRGAA